MAEDLLGLVPSGKGLDLGRAQPNAQRPWMSTMRAQGAQQQGTVLGAVLDLGEQIASNSLDEARRQRFYEGQNRILTSALEGKQQQELRAILKDQPWYAEVLGNGAMAKGAIEQAGRSGAGKMFDSWLTSMPQDLKDNPEVYKGKVFGYIQSQLTGDPDVDNAFLPSMTKMGELLVQTQLQKHLEYNTQQTVYNATSETYSAVMGVENASVASRGAGSTFDEQRDPKQWTPEEGAAYQRALLTFDPKTAPANLGFEQWQNLKLETALPLIKAGSTVLAKAMDESGFTEKLTPKERTAFDAARKDGRAWNDAQKQNPFIDQELSLLRQVHNSESEADLPALYLNAYALRDEMLASGAYTRETLPAEFKNDAAVQKWVKDGQSRILRAEDKQEARAYAEAQAVKRKNERLYEIRLAATLKASEGISLSTQIIENVKNGNPLAPTVFKTADGRVIPYLPSQKELTDAYEGMKVAFLQADPNTRKQLLESQGVTSIEQLAKRFNQVDPETKGQTTVLGYEVGNAQASGQVQPLLDKLMRVDEAGGDAYLASHFADSDALHRFRAYRDSVKFGGLDPQKAWTNSFAQSKTIPVDKITSTQLNEKVRKEVGSLAPATAANAVAMTNVARLAEIYHSNGRDAKTSVTNALQDVQANSDIVAGRLVPGVPYEQRLHNLIGVAAPKDADAALLNWINSQNAGIKNYSVLYSNRTGHAIQPMKDGIAYGDIILVDYDAVRGAIQNPQTMIDAMRNPAPVGSFVEGLTGPQSSRIQ